jgi:hypothetical protein
MALGSRVISAVLNGRGWVALLAVASGAPARADEAGENWKRRGMNLPESAQRPTVRTPACELSGSLVTEGTPIYATETADKPAVLVTRVDVARLAPARDRAGRLPVRIEWPIVTEGWIDHDDAPFELLTRVDVVKSHLWLSPGARVSTFDGRDGKVQMFRPGARKGARPPTPDGHQASLPCEQLALANFRYRKLDDAGWQAAFRGPIEIFTAPRGAKIAQFELGRAWNRVVQQRRDWYRVRTTSSYEVPNADEYLPFDIDGWVRKRDVLSPLDAPLGGLIGSHTDLPSHVATAQAPLRTEPRGAAPVRARLALGAPILAGPRSSGFVAVKLLGIRAPDDRDLWLAESDLVSATIPYRGEPSQRLR